MQTSNAQRSWSAFSAEDREERRALGGLTLKMYDEAEVPLRSRASSRSPSPSSTSYSRSGATSGRQHRAPGPTRERPHKTTLMLVRPFHGETNRQKPRS